MSVFRAFIAVELSSEVLEQLEQIVEGLRGEIGENGVRWVPAGNIHLTLKFLGDVSMSNVDMVKKILQVSTSGYGGFAVSVGSVGAFPSPQRARVIWAGVEGPPELAAMQRMIDLETARLGYASENREFKPHLTLGRVARNVNGKEMQKIAQVLKETKVGFLGLSQVKEVHLFRSDLHPSGAVYRKVFTAPLGEKK